MKISQMTFEGYEDWLEENYEELNIRAAEAGLDREYDFDFDNWAEALYEVHLCHHA